MSGVRNLLLAGAVAMAAGVGAAAPAKADGFFWDRLHNQQVRIHEGVQKGSLTRGEAASLTRGEAARLEAQERQLAGGCTAGWKTGATGSRTGTATGCGTRSTSRATGIHDQRTDDQFRRERRDDRGHDRRYSSNERWWQRDRD